MESLVRCVMGFLSFMDLRSQQEQQQQQQLHESLANWLTYGCKPVKISIGVNVRTVELKVDYLEITVYLFWKIVGYISMVVGSTCAFFIWPSPFLPFCRCFFLQAVEY